MENPFIYSRKIRLTRFQKLTVQFSIIINPTKLKLDKLSIFDDNDIMIVKKKKISVVKVKKNIQRQRKYITVSLILPTTFFQDCHFIEHKSK